MDIEERAEKWALDNIPHNVPEFDEVLALLAKAYLAGSAQTQADYVSYYC